MSTPAADFNYFIPHNRPILGAQNADGIVDTFSAYNQVKFGLMTMDGIGTLRDWPPLMDSASFNTWLIPQMFAQVEQGKMTATEAASAAQHEFKPIFAKWRARGKI